MNEENWKAGNPKAAFPVYAKDDGMTLRDYFAAKAMQGWVSYYGSSVGCQESVAHAAYKLADSMMKGGETNDTQRLDWLERNPERLLVHDREGDTHKFSILLEKGQYIPDREHRDGGILTDPTYSQEYETLREALDKGMKQVL